LALRLFQESLIFKKKSKQNLQETDT